MLFERLRNEEAGAMSAAEFAIVAALAALAFQDMNAEKLEVTKEQIAYLAADDLKAFHLGCGAYIRDTNNTGTIWAATASGPQNLAPATLSSKLPTGFNDRSPIGQNFMCTVKRTDGSLEYASFNYGGDNTLDDIDLNLGAFRIGTFGGAVTSRNPNDIVTTKRFTSQPKSNFDAAVSIPTSTLVAVSKYGVGGLSGDHIHRNSVPGLPEANTMNADLTMNNVDIQGAVEIRTAGIAEGAGIGDDEVATLNNLDSTTSDGTAAVAATPSTIVYRDTDGTFQAATPVDDADVVTKAYADALSGGSGPCGADPEPGDVCSDGLTYLGYNSATGKSVYYDASATKPYGERLPNGDNNDAYQIGMLISYTCEYNDDHQPDDVCRNLALVSKKLASINAGSPDAYCEDLVSQGYDDWQMPEFSDLMAMWMIGDSDMPAVGTTWTSDVNFHMAGLDYANQNYTYTPLFQFYNYGAGVDYVRFATARYTSSGGTTSGVSGYTACVRAE